MLNAIMLLILHTRVLSNVGNSTQKKIILCFLFMEMCSQTSDLVIYTMLRYRSTAYTIYTTVDG